MKVCTPIFSCYMYVRIFVCKCMTALLERFDGIVHYIQLQLMCTIIIIVLLLIVL